MLVGSWKRGVRVWGLELLNLVNGTEQVYCRFVRGRADVEAGRASLFVSMARSFGGG